MLNAALLEFARTLGWSLVAALCMGIGLGLTVKVFDYTTPGLDEIEELKKGNMAVAVVLGAVIISVGFVIGMALFSGGE
ncbi:MAG: DUF350 domain-containing protein [Armatimonadetes bacterium]|nr:DUF350 domain-containing protein [Armatimonadota bacterium]